GYEHVRDGSAAKMIVADRQGDAGRDRERRGQRFMVSGVSDLKPIAVVELSFELGVGRARFEMSRAVPDVVEGSGIQIPTHPLAVLRPRAEAARHEVLLDVGAPYEPDLRIEMRSHDDMIHLRAVSITRVVELRAIARVVAGDAGRLCTCPVGVNDEIRAKGKSAVGAVRLVVADAGRRDRALGE